MRINIDLRGWRAELATFVLVVLVALGALALTALVGLAALVVCRLLGSGEDIAHNAEYIASGGTAGVLTVGMFMLGRANRKPPKHEEDQW